VAKNELVNTNAKIYLIAENVGFINVGYFSQVFKKASGCTPEQYRANNQNQHTSP
jgi:two-component system response regulator YesN